MVESPVSIHTEWSPERIREVYPNGAFVYYAPTGDSARIHTVLTHAIPDTLIVVDDTEHSAWTPFPQDGMVQLGDSVYLMPTATCYRDAILRHFDGLSREEIHSLIPKQISTKELFGFDVVGGETIRVGGADEIWITGLSEEKIAKLDSSYPLYPMQILKQLAIRAKNFNPKLLDNVLYYQRSKYGREFSHEDMLATAFVRPGGGYIWYVDEPLREYAIEHGRRDVQELFETSTALPHEYTRQGGANIWYEWNTRTGRWIAFVPSIDAIGPIAQDLHRSGYAIVELGEEQFSHHAGVKCKSMHMYWREE